MSHYKKGKYAGMTDSPSAELRRAHPQACSAQDKVPFHGRKVGKAKRGGRKEKHQMSRYGNYTHSKKRTGRSKGKGRKQNAA